MINRFRLRVVLPLYAPDQFLSERRKDILDRPRYKEVDQSEASKSTEFLKVTYLPYLRVILCGRKQYLNIRYRIECKRSPYSCRGNSLRDRNLRAFGSNLAEEYCVFKRLVIILIKLGFCSLVRNTTATSFWQLYENNNQIKACTTKFGNDHRKRYANWRLPRSSTLISRILGLDI